MYGTDFPGETFRVLKNDEPKKYGEYPTRRLGLEAGDRLGLAPCNRYGRYEARAAEAQYTAGAPDIAVSGSRALPQP